MEQLNIEQNTPEWLEARKQYRTASEAPIVLGISPFTSITNFKLIKAGLKTQYYSKAMQQGHDLEDQVRQHACDYFGKDFKAECWTNGKYMASIDGIDGDTIVEIKVSDYTYNMLAEGVPDYYEMQVLQQLYCSPAKVGYLYVYSPKANAYACSHAIELSDCPDFLERLEAAWDAFDTMPVPEIVDETNNAAIRDLFYEYDRVKADMDQSKARLDAIKEQLITLADNRTLTADGYKIAKSKPRVTYDYKSACTDAKLDLEAYRKEGEGSWSITCPKSPFDV